MKAKITKGDLSIELEGTAEEINQVLDNVHKPEIKWTITPSHPFWVPRTEPQFIPTNWPTTSDHITINPATKPEWSYTIRPDVGFTVTSNGDDTFTYTEQ